MVVGLGRAPGGSEFGRFDVVVILSVVVQNVVILYVHWILNHFSSRETVGICQRLRQEVHLDLTLTKGLRELVLHVHRCPSLEKGAKLLG